MVMSPTNGNDTSSLQRMINRARRAAGFTSREQLLIDRINSPAPEAAMPPTPYTSDEPPEEFVAILRMPAGERHRLAVAIDGADIALVLNSRGEADPERESYLWRWLLQRVRQEAGQ